MILHRSKQRQYLVFLTFSALYHGKLCGVNEMMNAPDLFLAWENGLRDIAQGPA